MARRRKYREDLAYSEWHRHRLAELYKRIGHRLDMADRDWTEFCHHCKIPLAIMEEVVDRGQNLDEKSTRVTRNLARMAEISAYLIAPRTERPRAVQDEIDRLGALIFELEAAYPIVEFHIKELYPEHTGLRSLTPDEAAEFFLLLHRRHHETCQEARRAGEFMVKRNALRQAMKRHGMVPETPSLFDEMWVGK